MNEERTFWDSLFAGLVAFGASVPAVMAQMGMEEFRRHEPRLYALGAQEFAMNAHLTGQAVSQPVFIIPYYQTLNQPPRNPQRRA